jgi:hypothetical protein
MTAKGSLDLRGERPKVAVLGTLSTSRRGVIRVSNSTAFVDIPLR